MSTVKIELLDQPSRSKGWGRYRLKQAGNKIVQSRTGNEWVSASHEGAFEGEATLTVQVSLKEGRKGKESTYTKEMTLIAKDGATTEVKFHPGSQGIKLRISGAEVRE